MPGALPIASLSIDVHDGRKVPYRIDQKAFAMEAVSIVHYEEPPRQFPRTGKNTLAKTCLFRVGEIGTNRSLSVTLRSAATKNLQSLPRWGRDTRGGLRDSTHED